MKNDMRGFTLVELMVTIAVAAVLMTLAAPNFRNFIKRNAVTTQANGLRASMQFARGEAVARHVATRICPSVDGEGCSPGADFDAGWVVLGYPTTSATGTPEVLQVMEATSHKLSLKPLAGSGIVFDGRGELASTTQAEVRVCARDGASETGESTTAVPGKRVVVSASGRVSVLPLAADADCG